MFSPSSSTGHVSVVAHTASSPTAGTLTFMVPPGLFSTTNFCFRYTCGACTMNPIFGARRRSCFCEGPAIERPASSTTLNAYGPVSSTRTSVDSAAGAPLLLSPVLPPDDDAAPLLPLLLEVG